MRYYFITFRSVTYAQQGERLLKGSGFRCVLQRTPRWMEEQGCGYALRVRAPEIEPATALLAQYQPLLVDAVPLTLEEIFIYELGGADYAVKDIVL